MRKLSIRLVSLLAFGVLAGWWVLLESLSAAPTQADVTTFHTIAYHNHGKTVFITPTQDRLRLWLPVAGLTLVLCAVLARIKRK